jgi:hypothetical protein
MCVPIALITFLVSTPFSDDHFASLGDCPLGEFPDDDAENDLALPVRGDRIGLGFGFGL